MLFSKLILLFVILKIDCLAAMKTVSCVIDDSAEVNIENSLIEFVTDLKKFSFDKLDHRRLIVLGKKENLLQATKVLLESGMPYFISTQPDATLLPSNFGVESVVLFFIDGFTDSEMNLTFAKLPKDYKCKALLLSLVEERTSESIATTLASAFEMKLKNVLLARFNGKVMKIYGKVMNADCGDEISLLNTWKSKRGFKKNENILGHNLVPDARGCPMFVSTFDLSPTMVLREDENKSLHISGGIEGRLVKSIAEHLNIVPVVKVPSMEVQYWVTPNGTQLGIVGDVARELAGFGIGLVASTLDRTKVVDLTTYYNHECVVWTVPRKTKYDYSVVISEFSPTTWIMVILSVSICCGLVYITPRLKIGSMSPLNICDVIAMTLNYAIPRHPSGVLCKIFFLVYLHYSRVLTTAYSTSLSSILTTKIPEPAIVDEEGILAAGLRTAGTQGTHDMLDAQISPNSTRAELLDNFEIITSVETALARIVDRKDIAYLRHYSTINYVVKGLLMIGKSVEFYTLPGCVMSYDSVMVTPKGSHLTDKVNNVIIRLREAGMYRHWISLDHRFYSQPKKLKYNKQMLSRLDSIFIIYLYCLIPAFLAFGAELVAFKLQLNWFTR